MLMRQRKQRIFSSIKFYIAILLSLIILSLISLTIIKNSLISSGKRFGEEISKSYALEEEKSLVQYETLMSISSEYIDQQLSNSQDAEQWIEDYLKNIIESSPNTKIDPYVIIDKKIIAANPWEGDDDYDFLSTNWYKLAIQGQGKIIYTDVYKDAISGNDIITIAKMCNHPNVVLAFDIFASNFKLEQNEAELPKGSIYFYCDGIGNLIYTSGFDKTNLENQKKYLERLIEQINNGNISENGQTIKGNNGVNYVIFFYTSHNGWNSVMLIPENALLANMTSITYGYLAVILSFIFIAVLFVLREFHLTKSFDQSLKTINALGNSYYAIYIVDLNKNQYEIIKGSKYINNILKKQGDYEDLLDACSKIIEPSAYQDFINSFSLEKIRYYIEQGYKDFGGDFKRLFDNEYKWVNVRLLFDKTLNKNEAILCFREVDFEKKRQLQQFELLTSALETATKSEKSKNLFFSSMSHDMRTPLNGIIGLCNLAKMQGNNIDEINLCLDKILFSGKQLLNIVNEILEMSKLENTNIQFEMNKFNLRVCLDNIISMFRSEYTNGQKQFNTNVNLIFDEVICDEKRIIQIINNLLSNAFKFTNDNGIIDLSVEEICVEQNYSLKIIVEDNGIGMSEEFIKKIFIPYEREQRFENNFIVGTGLGMSIVKNIVSQMNGDIVVESELQKGTKFTVLLPIKVHEENNIISDINIKFSLKNKNILISDDNEINLEMLKDMLELKGANVICSSNGKEAYEKFISFDENYFDLILMDMNMPVLDGCEATKLIRNSSKKYSNTVTIIAVTANAFSEDIAKTIASGMDGHIMKPIDLDNLEKMVDEIVNKKK